MRILRLLAAACLSSAAAFFVGCEIDSATDVQRNVGADFTGFYRNDSGGAIVSKNTGAAISTLDLRQGGDRLEAIDNNGIIFRGSIGDFDGSVASFNMTGRTTVGNEATISGTLTASGNTSTNASAGATTGTMQGTWVEDSLFSTVRAVATVPGVTSGGGGGGGAGSLSVSPSDTTVGLNNSRTFTASGGTGNFSWSLDNNTGSLSSTSGSSITYTRTISGADIIRVQDTTSGRTATAQIN